MHWNIGRPFVPLPLLDQWDRVRLRRAALTYARQGWPVTPGAYLSGARFSCGRPGCPIMNCHPATESWPDDASTDPVRVAGWWRHRPYAVLLATGHAFDVLEVPATLGLRALRPGRPDPETLGPVAATATGRWMFLVRPDQAVRPELAHRVDIVRHGHGSWIPAAPTRAPEGPVRWAVSPEETRWRLPAAEPVQQMLVDALGSARSVHSRQPVVPRQLSTSRRAA